MHALFAAIIAASSGQDAAPLQDWDVSRDPRRSAIAASTQFSSGLAIAVRCTDGNLTAAIYGLPEAPREMRRSLRLRYGDDAVSDQMWFVATPRTTAMSPFPAQFARALRAGGSLQISARGADGRNLRHVVDLPASASAVEQVLNACGRELVDPRDADLADLPDDVLARGLTWNERPRPEYPKTNQRLGFATVSCLAHASGRVSDCIVETEYPAKAGFGANTVAAAERATVMETGEGASVPVRKLSFTAMYQVGMDAFTTGSGGAYVAPTTRLRSSD